MSVQQRSEGRWLLKEAGPAGWTAEAAVLAGGNGMLGWPFNAVATPWKVGLLPRKHVSWLDGRMQGSVGERLAPTALPKILSTSGNALLPISQKGSDGVTHSGSVTGGKGGLCFLDLCGDRGSQRW
jgi:hypothetical protein